MINATIAVILRCLTRDRPSVSVVSLDLQNDDYDFGEAIVSKVSPKIPKI